MQMKITVNMGGKKNTDLNSKSYTIADCRSVEQVAEILEKEFKEYFQPNATLDQAPTKAKK
jgi:hypothetical protein